MSQALFRNRARRGAIVQEAVVALGLVVVVMVGVAQLLALAAQQRRSSQQRACAVREAGNVMEQLMACPWDEADPQGAAAIRLSPAAARELPEPRLSVEVVPEGEVEQVKRIAIHIDWRTATAQHGQPVRLVGWRYRIGPPPGDVSASEPVEDQP